MTEAIASTLFLFSILFPTKLWYQPDQPVTIDVKATEPVHLVLVDFLGRAVDTQENTTVEEPKQVDVKSLFPAAKSGTFILYAVPKGKQLPTFVGTPLVVQIRVDKRAGAQPGPMVWRVEPLRYAVMETSAGKMTMSFFYDVAPNTVGNFLRLSEEGYYDGQVFHRIIKDFVLQAGDPLGRDPDRAGSGGPGFLIDAEFNDRQHVRGVLSMARQGDDLERQGLMPRSDFANSASSQFFIALNHDRTKALDGRYTAFGQVVDGLDALDKLEASETGKRDRPVNPPEIKSVTVHSVTPEKNPYKIVAPD
jgi:cyclophilin family peptidyl-prolyl cis-trans isomerase